MIDPDSVTQSFPVSFDAFAHRSDDSETSGGDPSSSLSLSVSDAARRRALLILDHDELLLIKVKGGGCAGYSVDFEIFDMRSGSIDPDERRLMIRDVPLLISSEALSLLHGCTVDFVESPAGSYFRIQSAKATTCGCGVSFGLAN